MDHNQYLLTMFFADDDSFFKYLASQDDESSLSDILQITQYLDFLLLLLIQSKNKLEAVGHCYESLSEEYRQLTKFTDSQDFKKLFNKVPIVTDGRVKLNKGYLFDFVISLMRFKKESSLATTAIDPIRYIDPRRDIAFSNVMDILKSNKVNNN
ncbi:core component [Vaccinia virus Ankara]|uniref:Virion assembly protein OPG100 n=5 Tax=Vaccinia virus TaxID=10245 RepID=PG100_VACCC|nr:RecName: Full=Virion assembly protein OPG100; AltName: Full=Protein J1 [Vaccinia virus Copenhagen]AAW23504.1 dimeric virion protein [Vaccinia virus]UJQ44605.1 protein J1 [Buffalopox virus]CAM58263.1 core component [Vaccinia virus Ankara]BBD06161.1 putative J1R [BAC cloning vector pLC16m8.8S-BAC]AAA48081.1 putative J1R [Vaccinia virus Copenhagen]